jgi:hypothetical protein
MYKTLMGTVLELAVMGALLWTGYRLWQGRFRP